QTRQAGRQAAQGSGAVLRRRGDEATPPCGEQGLQGRGAHEERSPSCSPTPAGRLPEARRGAGGEGEIGRGRLAAGRRRSRLAGTGAPRVPRRRWRRQILYACRKDTNKAESVKGRLCAEKLEGRGGSTAKQIPPQPGTTPALGLRARA